MPTPVGTASPIKGSYVSSITIGSFACSGSARMIAVGVATCWSISAVSSVVRGGSETFGGGFTDSASPQEVRLLVYASAPGPGTGAADIVVTFADNAAAYSGAFALAFSDVDQAAPLGTAVTSNGASSDLSNTPAADDADLVIDVAHWRNDSNADCVAGANQTEQLDYNFAAGTDYYQLICSTQAGDVAGDVMSWTLSGGGVFRSGAVAIKPGTEAAPPTYFPGLGFSVQQRMG